MLKQMSKKNQILLIAALAAAGMVIVLFGLDMKQRTGVSSAMEQYEEMSALSKLYSELSSSVNSVEKRSALSKGDSLPIVVESMITDIGLKERLRSVKPFGGGTKGNYEVQEAEVLLEKLSMNELINVLHGIYTEPAGLFVTAAEFKRDFTERETINAQLSLKMVSLPKEAGE